MIQVDLSNIVNIRVIKNINQKEIVEFLGISKGTYSAWENGSDIIPLSRLNDICSYLNISIDYALGLTKQINYSNSNQKLDINKIGNNLRKIRKENNYTLELLAEKLNTSISVLSRYENGKTLIITPFVLAYAKLFNLSIDYIIGKIDNPIKLNFK